MVYSIVSFTIFVIVSVYFVNVAMKLITKRGPDRTEYIRNYKLGDGFFIYSLTIPMYYLGLLYGGNDWLVSIFAAVGQGIKTVVLDFSYDDIEELFISDSVYKISILCCFVACCLNTALLVISLLSQYIFATCTKIGWACTHKSGVMILGNNTGSRKLYETVTDEYAVLAGKFEPEESGELYASRIRYLVTKDVTEEMQKALRKSQKAKTKISIIINTQDDEQNLHLLRAASRCLQNEYEKAAGNREEKTFEVDLFSRIQIIGFKNPAYADIYEKIEKEGYGCIRCISKYELLADDFLYKYPMIRCMPEEILDVNAATVSEESRISFEFFGMDTYNEELLLDTMMENQFPVKKADGRIQLKETAYHVFDENGLSENPRITRGIMRFQEHFLKTAQKEDYLEFPELPGHIYDHHVNLYSAELIDVLLELPHAAPCCTYAIVSVGNDIDNLIFAEKLLELTHKYNWQNYHVFARVRNETDNNLIANEEIHTFGNEDSLVYDYETLIAQRLNRMAMMRNRAYAVTKGTDSFLADYHWYTTISPLERLSNVNCVKNLKFKMKLMGLDMIEKEDADKGFVTYSKEEYLKCYDKVKVTLACQEHFRWSAFYLCAGYLPANRDAILHEAKNGKNELRKTHGNLTSMKGLIEFRQLIAERDSKNEMDCDVIKYDYDIMDSAYDFLDLCGYKVGQIRSF